MKFLDREIDEDLFKKLIVLAVALIFLYVVFTLISYSMVKPFKISSNTITNSKEIVSEISIIYQGSVRLELKGWAYKEGQSIETFESYFILKNEENNKMYSLKTQMEEIDELKLVEETFDCSKGGMYSQGFLLGLEKGVYDICILYKNDSENILANTGHTITK